MAEARYWRMVDTYEHFVETFEEIYCKHCPCRRLCLKEENLQNCIDREWGLYLLKIDEEGGL